ncbi:hypothetical protein ABIB51_001182 [Arthrobacter sp. UYCu712]
MGQERQGAAIRQAAGFEFVRRDQGLFGLQDAKGVHQGPGAVSDSHLKKHPWWQVMCLTGVDYFSTIGYQPAIAALAAGVISPLATLVLVAVTLLGALPVYRRVAGESRHGPRHPEPLCPELDAGPERPGDLVPACLLGAVFLRGFKEAIGVAVVLVGIYLSLNVIVVITTIFEVFAHPVAARDWWLELTTSHGNPFMVVRIALLVFPKLALGLSGFETGVAVMPQVQGRPGDTEDNPVGRIEGTRRLLTPKGLGVARRS